MKFDRDNQKQKEESDTMSENREPTSTSTIAEFQSAAHQLAKKSGWWDEKTKEQEMAEVDLAALGLVHREISEAMEKIRRGASVRDSLPKGDVADLMTAAYQVVRNMHTDRVSLLAKVTLMHSELSEAAECCVQDTFLGSSESGGTADSRGKPEGFVVELADTVIRIFDTCGRWGLNLAHAIVDKHKYNATRPPRHGGKLA